MAATAYAFVVSLMNTMDSIQIHPRLSTCFDNHHFQSLRENLDSLLHFVENHSDDSVFDVESSEEEDLDLLSRIATVAQLTEDLIEVEAADQIRDLSTSQKTQSFLLNLQTKIEEMDSIINEEAFTKVKEERPSLQLQGDLLLTPASLVVVPLSSSSSSTSASMATVKKSSMVGFDGYVEQLLDELTGYHSGRRILPIVGMGGVGKTTLARNVYENQLSVERFTVRVWITVSQTYTVRDIFLQALSCLGESTGGRHTTKSDDEIGEELHKTLYGRRYLIILDDMWSVGAWETIKFYFPDNCNGSRILVTTRQQQLVDYFASPAVAVALLDDKNSWELLCDKIFGHHEQGVCPLELQQVGEKIVKRCKGLPLAISVIGGLLAKSLRTQEHWEKIAEDKSLVLKYSSGTSNNNALSILYTSYKHLPVCLKSCFLYLGLFPEDDDIYESKLVPLWIVEGLIKPNRNQSLEEVASSCIKELVDRNLLLVGEMGVLKEVFSYHVHDLVRELMIRIAEKEKFYYVQSDIAGKYDCINDERTASFYPLKGLACREESPISVYNPLKFPRGQNGASFKSRLQRVMVDPIAAHCEEVNLRLIYDISRRSTALPSSTLSLFWGLQTIIFHPSLKFSNAPVDIWKMPQLRHIDIRRVHILDPPPTVTGEDVTVLHNLHTLRIVRDLRITEEVCKRIPDVKKLEIMYASNLNEKKNQCLHNLKKLESLLCVSHIEYPFQNLKLPDSLEKLTLQGCHLAWSDMEMIGALPRLQYLDLEEGAVVGAEWNLEVKFVSLKHLEIKALHDLRRWIAEASNFPVLEKLHLSYLTELDEVPAGIGEIPTLETLYLSGCTDAAIMSAIKILEEQESLGNDDFQLQLQILSKGEAQRWREHIQQLGITSQNLSISQSL